MQQTILTNLISVSFQEITHQPDSKEFKKLHNQFISLAKSSEDPFKLWYEIDEQIGKLYQSKLQPTVIDLRNQFVEKFIAYEKDRLNTLFKKSPEKGWQEWLLLITTSISQFRDTFHSKFSQIEFPFPDDKVEKVNDIKKSVQYIIEGLWADAYNSIENITSLNFIPKERRLELYVILGEIQQYHFYKLYKADKFFSEAEKISSDHHRILASRGKFFLEQGKIKKSKEYYSKLVKLHPNRSSGYTGMGNIAEKQEEEAEKWYKDAVKYSAGDIAGYFELAKFYIRTRSEGINKLINDLKKQILYISPESEYEFHIQIGYEFQKAYNYKEALIHYDKALKLNRNRSGAFSQKGFLFLDSNYEQNFEKAQSNFETVIKLLPDSIAGYLNMAYAYELEGNWSLALKWNKECPDRIIEYRDRIFAAQAQAYRHLKDNKRSEKELKKAFAFDNKSLWAKIHMEKLAEDYYVNNGDKETAISLYNEILNNIGESYKADYYNRIGNLRYHFYEYELAVEQYELAVKHNPENAVFHQNLSLAYQGLKKYDKAITEIKRAYKLDSDELVYKQKLASLYNAKGNDLFSSGKYVEAIAEYKETIKLVPNDDIYYSNLAGAYENLKETTSRLEALDKGIYYYQKARDINPKDGYTNNINSIKKKKEFVPYFGEKSLDRLPVVTPIAIEVAGNLIPLVESEGNSLSPRFQEWINILRNGLQYELGHVKVPGIRVRGNETDLPDGTYIIMINEIPLVSGNVRLDKILVNDTVDRLTLLNIKGEEAINPANGSECAWIPSELQEMAEKAELTTWDALGYMTLHLAAVIRKNFAEFVTIQNVTDQIKAKKRDYYQIISEANGGISRFTDILKIFAEEEVPIKELEAICETYIELTRQNVPLYEIVEELRYHEKIRPLLPVNKSDIERDLEYRIVYELDNNIVDVIANGIIMNGDAALLALEPEPTQEILTAVRNEVSNLPPTAQNPIIMTEDWRIRRHVRKLVELEFPHLAVMSKREIIKKVKTIATITLE